MARLSLEISADDRASPILAQILQRVDGLAQRGQIAGRGLADTTARAREQLQEASRSAAVASVAVEGLSKATALLLLRLGGTVGAILTLVRTLRNTAAAAVDAEAAMGRLQGAMSAAGLSFIQHRGSVEAWAKSLQAATRFSGDEFVEALGRVLTRVKDLDQAQRLVRLSADAATLKGRDLASTADSLAEAAVSGNRGLASLRREFGENVKGARDISGAFNALQRNIGGTAERSGGLSKTLAQTKNASNDLSQAIGKQMTPALELAAGGLTGVFRRATALYTDTRIADGQNRNIKALREEILELAKQRAELEKTGKTSIGLETKIKEKRSELSKEEALIRRRSDDERKRQAAGLFKFDSEISEDELDRRRQVSAEAESDRRRGLVETRAFKSELAAREFDEAGMFVDAEEERRAFQLEKDIEAFRERASEAGLSFEEQQAAVDRFVSLSDRDLTRFGEKQSGAFQIGRQAAEVAAGRMSQSIATAVDAMIFEGKSLEESFKGVFQSILREAVQTAIQIGVRFALLGAAGLGGGGAVGGIFGAVFGQHGIARVPGPVGRPVPALLHGGETVSTFGAPAAGGGGGGGGGGQVSIVINLQVADLHPSERRRVVEALAQEVRQASDAARVLAGELAILSGRTAGRAV